MDSINYARVSTEPLHSLLASVPEVPHFNTCCSIIIPRRINRDTSSRTSTVHSIYFSFAYQFPDVAAVTDLLYISRSSAVCPTLQTLASIQSSTSFSQDLFGLPLLLWPFTFLLVLICPSSVFGVVLYVRNNLIFTF